MSDTLYAKPGEFFFPTLTNAPTGLVGTLAVRIIDDRDDSTPVARSTEDIVEFPAGSGSYRAKRLPPEEEADEYRVFWDWGEGPSKNASDDLVVSQASPVPVEPGYDITTDVGKIRLLISDVGGADGKSFIFLDNEIEAFLSMSGSVKYAAAQALRTIAANTAQVQARIKYLELSTDGPAVAKALNELADKYEKEAIDSDEDGDVEIAAMSEDGFIP